MAVLLEINIYISSPAVRKYIKKRAHQKLCWCTGEGHHHHHPHQLTTKTNKTYIKKSHETNTVGNHKNCWRHPYVMRQSRALLFEPFGWTSRARITALEQQQNAPDQQSTTRTRLLSSPQRQQHARFSALSTAACQVLSSRISSSFRRG